MAARQRLHLAFDLIVINNDIGLFECKVLYGVLYVNNHAYGDIDSLY
jgi:hypothetical protein